jgi:putative heme iron utilization protein
MKKQLLDRATAIHTVKVAKKTISNDVVKASLNQIGAFRAKIGDANSDQYDEILNEINNWAATSPIVTESDILELRSKLK